MMKSQNVIIIGSGVAGLATALFLKKAGMESTIYESRSDEELETGAGFLLSPNGVKILDGIGCKNEVIANATVIKKIQQINSENEVEAIFHNYSEKYYDAPLLNVMRDQIIKSLLKEVHRQGIEMKYNKIINLKNGKEALLRNGEFADGEAVFVNFNETHAETDYLLSYPDENSFDAQQEAEFLKEKAESSNEIEIVAVVDGVVAGTAGIEAVGTKYKLKHRAELGIAILKEYWGLGIGKALMEACIECAKDAGYTQLELNVVAENERAVALYRKMGFVEYGRNPRGFNSRVSGYQEVVYMLLEL